MLWLLFRYIRYDHVQEYLNIMITQANAIDKTGIEDGSPTKLKAPSSAVNFFHVGLIVSAGLTVVFATLTLLLYTVRYILQHCSIIGDRERQHMKEFYNMLILNQERANQKNNNKKKKKKNSSIVGASSSSSAAVAASSSSSSAASSSSSASVRSNIKLELEFLRKAPISYHFMTLLYVIENFFVICTVWSIQTAVSVILGFEISNEYIIYGGWVWLMFVVAIILIITSSLVVTLHVCRNRIFIPSYHLRHLIKSTATTSLLNKKTKSSASPTGAAAASSVTPSAVAAAESKMHLRQASKVDISTVVTEYSARDEIPEDEQYQMEMKMDQEYFAMFRGKACLDMHQLGEYYILNVFDGLRKRFCLFVLLFLAVVIFGLFHLLFMFGTCICSNPDTFSSTFTRLFEKNNCERNTICFEYLSLSTRPHQEMIIKFQTSVAATRAYVMYDTVSSGGNSSTNEPDYYRYKKACIVSDMNNNFVLDYERRFVFTCELTDLQPDTVYYYKNVIDHQNDDGDGTTVMIKSKKEYKFRTLHSDSLKDHNFVVGGDYSVNEIGHEIFAKVASLNPSFLVIGGDLAYDNGFPSCFKRWDQFFEDVSTYLVTKDGFQIPILSAIGNHEAMYGKFQSSREGSSNYLTYFSHELTNGTVSNLYYRSTSYMVKLSNHTIILVLDSDVLTAHKQQVDWIEQVMEQHGYNAETGQYVPNRIAVYHTPLYPSARSYWGLLSYNGRIYWEPLFNKYNFTLCFEHHDHAYKRTIPISNNTPVTADDTNSIGVVYLGDGSMGADPKEADGTEAKRWYIQKRLTQAHVYQVTTKSVANGAGVEVYSHDERPNTAPFDSVARNSSVQIFYNKRQA